MVDTISGKRIVLKQKMANQLNIATAVFENIDKVIEKKIRWAVFQHQDEICEIQCEIIEKLVPSFCGEGESTLEQFIAILKEVRTKNKCVNW